MENPLVSVIIPMYNRGGLIYHTLNSVANQTYKHLEVIIVDDGSTDDSANIAKKLLQELNLSGHVYSIKNSGANTARSYGIIKANGDIFFPLDSDDLWLPEYLETMVDIVIKYPEISLVFSDFYLWFDNENTQVKKSDKIHLMHSLPMVELENSLYKIEKEFFFTYLLQEQPIFPSAMAIRSTLCEKVGTYNKNIAGKTRRSEDWEFSLRCAHEFPGIYVKKALVKIRKHEGNISKDNSKQRESEIKVLDIVRHKFPLNRAEIKLVRYQISRRSIICAYSCFHEYKMHKVRYFSMIALFSRWGLLSLYYMFLSILPVRFLKYLDKSQLKIKLRTFKNFFVI